MSCQPESFYESIIAAGAIMTGFCGTFLSFRIQREANYYRQVAVSYDERKGRDVHIGKQHFTSAFLLLILAALCSMVFGFWLPLLALANGACTLSSPQTIAGGLMAASVLIIAYFLDELLHYEILSNRLLNDAREWRSELVVVVLGVILAIAVYFAIA